MDKNFKYIYGPVSSWRLGRSLGIDLLSQTDKVCNFNCIYCQVGGSEAISAERKIYAPTDEVVKELKSIGEAEFDYITLSGKGDPTLAKNLGEVIEAVKKIRKEPVAVLTNSVLMKEPDVRRELALADFVAAKLDSVSEESFRLVNKPPMDVKFSDVLGGIKQFRKEYKKKMALQVMFVKENKQYADELFKLCQVIKPDEVQINTPLRSCPTKPLKEAELAEIKEHFKGLKVITVYEAKRKEVTPISLQDTARRGRTP